MSRVVLLAVLVLPACSAAEPYERSAEERAPIVGGIPDGFRSYVVGVGQPYNLANPADPNSGPFCSGALISRRTVLTAGHCFTRGAGTQGGITAIFFGPDITQGGPGTIVLTARSVRHPGFDPCTLANDLTLVELVADAPSQAVPLLRETMTNTPAFIGPYFTFAGYGNDGNGNYGIRRAVTFPIDRIGPDATVGLDTGSGPIDATQFYYRVALENTCDGDSGGPSFFPQGHVERLAGVTSFGDSQCAIDGVDARTDAPAIAGFIQATIDLFEGMDPCRADGTCNESCNTNGKLVDPDCAPNHCGQDGICVLSCTDPPDPDCALPAGIDHCGPDGICDPTCSPADPDCLPPPDAGGGGTGGAASSSASAGTGGPDGGIACRGMVPDGGTGGAVPRAKSGCGCVVVGDEEAPGVGVAGALVLGLVAARRRRPRRDVAPTTP